MNENPLCANCLAAGIRTLGIYWKLGVWLCATCYDLSFDDPDD